MSQNAERTQYVNLLVLEMRGSKPEWLLGRIIYLAGEDIVNYAVVDEITECVNMELSKVNKIKR